MTNRHQLLLRTTAYLLYFHDAAMNKSFKIILTVVVGFLAYYILSRHFKTIMSWVDGFVNDRFLSYLLTYLLIGIPIVIATYMVDRTQNTFKSWGMGKSILKGVGVAFLFALPMLLGGYLFFPVNDDISVRNLLVKTLFAGLFEETFFRGFLFGMIFRYTKVGFIPAVVLGAIVFATGHLYQSSEREVQLGIFLVTFIGSGFFAWLLVEWEHNLWVIIFLHAFMNLAWVAFSMSEHAMGNVNANMLRALTIALAVIGTIIYRLKYKKGVAVNKRTLLWKN